MDPAPQLEKMLDLDPDYINADPQPCLASRFTLFDVILAQLYITTKILKCFHPFHAKDS
jgi:hypothetical protein